MRRFFGPTTVFAVPRYRYLQQEICAGNYFTAGKFNEGAHPNGEIWNRMPDEQLERVRGERVVVVGSTDQQDITSLLHCVSILSKVVAEVYILIPFFRYATHERRDSAGDVVAAKEICTRLSQSAVNGVRTSILFFDLHAENMEFYCDQMRVITDHIRAHDLWADLIQANTGKDKLFGPHIAIGSADFGRKNQVIALAEACKCTFGLVAKERLSSSETHTLGNVVGDVNRRTVILFDDMLRGGSSSIDGAKAQLQGGAKEVWVLITHPDFAGDPLGKLQKSGYVKGVIFGNTYPQYCLVEQYPSFAYVVPTGHYLANTLRSRYKL